MMRLKKSMSKKNAQILTCTEAVRPENLTIWVKFYVESEFRVENTKKMRPDTEN